MAEKEMTQMEKILDRLGSMVRKYVLPLYGRKMIVAAFAVAMYMIGIPDGAIEQGAAYVVANNGYFSDATYLWAIIMVFMGGALIDRLSATKESDVTKASRLSVWRYLVDKTQSIFQPSAFTGWAVTAALFVAGMVDDEILFIVSMSYVGVNSAEALLPHFNAFRNNLTAGVQAHAPEITKKKGG